MMRRALLLACALALAGCASAPRTMTGTDNFWSGRMALRVDSTPAQSFAASFELQGNPEQGRLSLSTALGTSLATLSWTPSGAEMRQGNTLTRRDSVDALMAELVGAAVPMPALFAWMRGEALSVPGWQTDLSQRAEGRLIARRADPLPTAELRLIIEP